MATPQLDSPLKRLSLVDSVYETLLQAIVSGGLSPGAELNSVELAEQLDVSRTPVKEAIKLLTHDGLARQVNHHKARVVQFSRQDIIEIYDLRKHLEGAAAEKATKFIDDDVLKTLRQQANQILQSHKEVDWAGRAIEYDIRFHETLAAACGNERLRSEISRYRLLVRGFCRMTGREATLAQAMREHIAILDALESRRPAAARKAMVAHIEARLKSVLEDVLDPEA